MGLFHRIDTPVEGTAQVTSCSAPEGDGLKAPCRMSLTVQAVGVAPFAVDTTLDVWTSSWPSVGDTLAVVFDLHHHDRIEIQWERMAPGYEAARGEAQAQWNVWENAGTGLHAPAPAAPPDDGTSRTVESVALVNNVFGRGEDSMWAPLELDLTVDVPGTGPVRLTRKFSSVRTKKWPVPGQWVPVSFPRGKPEKLKVDWGGVPKRRDGVFAQLHDFMRDDPGPSTVEVMVAPPAPAPAVPAAPAPNVLDELDKLGRLHERGILSDAEFAAAKQKLLG